jgi:uncharacterized membrane protein YdjX (TVP38/TMEM64 family)
VAIDPTLHPGLDAYRRRDFARAGAAWRELASSHPDAIERALLLSLVSLAGSLTPSAAADEHAARRFAEAEAALAELPRAVMGVDVMALRAELARGHAAATRRPPLVRAYSRFPVGAAVRFGALLLILVAGALALRFTPLRELLDRSRMVATFEHLRDASWAPLLLLGLFTALAPMGLPMTPLIIASGVVFGPWLGAIYNTVGCLLGAAASYWLGRLMGREFVRRIAGRRLKRIEALMRRRGFWGLVGVRFLPVPFPVVNYGAALAGVPFATFMVTATIGLLPSMLVYTNFAATLFEVARGGDRAGLGKASAALATVMVVSMTPTVVQQVRRRKRYRRLIVERHARRLRANGGSADAAS